MIINLLIGADARIPRDLLGNGDSVA